MGVFVKHECPPQQQSPKLDIFINKVAAFWGMHVSPAKHSLRDYQESMTSWQTDRQADTGQSDPYVPLCFAGDTIKVMVKVIDNGIIWKGIISWVCMPSMKSLSLTIQKNNMPRSLDFGHKNIHILEIVKVIWNNFWASSNQEAYVYKCHYWI